MQNRGGRGGRKGRNNSWWNRRRDKLRRPKSLGFESLESRLAMAVVINEFLADNESGITDLDDTRQDWIELKNTGLAAANIGGWYLTDDSLNLTKWQIPAGTTINPGQHLVIFASSKNLTGSELHTNFSLANNGEDLALVMADGTTIADAFLDYGPQDADVSFGVGVAPSSTSTETLVGNSSPVSFVAPTGPDDDRDDHWREIGYDDSAWTTGFGSVGKDTNGDALNFFTEGWLDADSNIASLMGDSTRSAYIRYEFNVTNVAQLTALELDLRLDDGFIVYLNGREMKRANFGEDFGNPQPSWNSDAGHQTTSSTAGGYNRGAEVADLVHFDLTPFLEFMVEGANVLAFHGVNTASTSSTTDLRDFLIQPTLTAKRANGASQEGYMVSPTPDMENGVAYLGLVDDTNFSVNRGFYETAQSVAITTTTADAVIRYTLDGSEPTLTNGLTYSGLVTVDPGLATIADGDRGVVTLRARAFKTGHLPTNVDTQTYVFASKVIYQNGNDVAPYETWGHDKEDADAATGYNLDDESDWAMDPDVVGGVETTQAVIDALKAIPTVSLVMNWDDLFGGTPQPGTPAGTTTVAPNTQGIYIVGRSDERSASMEILTTDGSISTQVDTVVEIQGHSSPNRWNTDKMSFQVKFKAPYGDSEFNQTLFGGTAGGDNSATEFDTLILDAGYNYTFNHSSTSQNPYARYVTDQVLADMQNLATGEGAPHGQWVHVYLNGMYWGVYNLHERPDDSFAAEYYGGDKDDYYVVKHASDIAEQHIWVEGGNAADAAYDNMYALTEIVAASDATDLASFQSVEEVLDVDQFIDYMIVHYYGGNTVDWSNNNWYATYNHVDPDGLWRFHAWDQEHAFPTNDNSDGNDQNINTTTKDQAFTPTGIHRNLIANDEYRLRFSDRVQELMRNDGVLTPAMAAAVYQARLTELDQAIIGESARWGDNRVPADPYTRLDWLRVNSDPTGDGRAVITDFFPGRTNVLLDQFTPGGTFTSNDWLATLQAPNFSQLGGEVADGYLLTLTNPNGAGSIYYTTDGSDPRNEGGTIHGTLYTGPFAISADVRIKARVLNTAVSGTKNDWSPVVDRTFSVAADPIMSLRIVELMYNPPGSADDTEFFEIINTGTQTADLAGVQITDFSTGGYTFSGGTLAAGEWIVVVKSQTAFAAAYPGVTNVAPGVFSGSLANEGEIVSLRGPGPANVLIQSFTYGDSNVAGWPADPDGEGNSLIYVGPFDAGEDPSNGAPADPFDVAANWAASPDVGGSPGTDDESDPIPGDYDNSGEVDNLDYTKWKSQYGMTVDPFTESDGNGDGIVDAVDYTVWRNNFGAMAPAAGSGGLTSRGIGGLAATGDVAEVEPAATADKSDRTSFGLIVADTSGVTLNSATGSATPSERTAEATDSSLLLWAVLGGDDAGADADESLDALVSSSNGDEDSTVADLWEDEDWLLELASL